MKQIGAFAFAILALGIAACGGGGGGVNAAPSSAFYAVSLGVVSNGTVQPASMIVLYDQQFLDPFHNAALVGAIVQPAPASSPSVSFSSSGSAVTLQQTAPGQLSLSGPVPTAPPGTTFAVAGSSYGVATITAQIALPAVITAKTTIYHFGSLSFGCRFRYTPAFAFDSGASATTTAADLYATLGSDQLGSLDPCTGTVFATAPGTPELWHTPYGGTFVPNTGLTDFAALPASRWRNDATQFTPQSGTLLFKTKGGLIVKAMVPIGPVEVSNASGTFPY